MVKNHAKIKAKRRAFVGIQQAHTVATRGYEPNMVRTGYENVIGQRTGEMFASSAKQDGKVITKTDHGILVEYKDGTRKGFALGMLYGKAEGSVYPHTLVSNMREGQKFRKGDYISYNTGFFEPDHLAPGSLVYKGSMMVRVALPEAPETHEDSSAISAALAARMTTTIAKPKSYVVRFKQGVHNVVKPGQKVNPEDPLLTIEDELTAMDDSLSDSSISILADMAKMTPRAGSRGTISWIEVIYHGDKADMSASLKALADRSDRRKYETGKSTGKPVETGLVNSDWRVDGTPLAVDHAELRVYINVDEPLGSGDKVVYGAQLKSVCGEVMNYKLTTESGLVVDAKMGAKSFAARIVTSLIEVGVRASTLDVITKDALKTYYGEH